MKTIQQCRQFFQAVTNATRYQRILKSAESRFRLCGRIAATFAVLLLISCTSLTPDRISTLVAIAAQAAQLGAQEWLRDHPDHRAAFQAVIDAINSELKAGNVTKAISMLDSLPTTTLRGKDGEVYVTFVETNRLVVYDNNLGRSTRIIDAAEKPVIEAVKAGLKRAMLPLPPQPPAPVALRAGRTRVQTTKVFTPTVALTNVAATVPVQLSPELGAAAALQLSRTNVTRSVVDIQHNEGAASMVSVRWVLGPASVYHVERQEGEGWCRFASLTNATATGQTNWCAVWSPALPSGTWRVLRVR